MFLKFILFISLVLNLYGLGVGSTSGVIDNIGGGIGNSDDDDGCPEIIVENINDAEDDAYMKYSYEEHCRDFKFQTKVDGYISVEYNATNDSNLTVGDLTVADYKEDYLFFKIDKDTEYISNFKRNDDNDTSYQIRFDFIKTVKEEVAESTCGGETTTSGMSFGCSSFNGGIKIPIINSGDLNISDIRVIYTKNGGHSVTANLECKIYPGTDDDPDNNESCVYNDEERAFFNFRDHTIPPDQNYTYNGEDRNVTYIFLKKDSIQLRCEDADIEIVYTADGKTYKGALEECIEPEFCYDYAYEQNGRFFTEDNNGTQAPFIKGSVSKTAPIDVKFYITNNPEADPKPNMSARDLVINIYDINMTQADYQDDSTKVILPRTIIQQSLIDDDDLNVTEDDGVKNLEDIHIGTVKANDRFYAKYTLDDINVTDINMSLDIKITYSTGLGEHEKRVGANDINLCPTRGYSYYPSAGLFNVVDKDNYDENEYYNIPTQVASREAKMEVLSMDANTSSDDLEKRTTVVGIELIDVSAFHYTEATCQEEASSINQDNKVWVAFNDSNKTMFDKDALQTAIDEGRTNLTVTSEFYKNIKRNTAFRMTYNTDNNDSVIELSKNGDDWDITNIDNLDDNGNECGTSLAKVQDECDDGDMSTEKLTRCMECLYGGVELTDSDGNNIDETTGTRFVCSRDNFSIRPEAFRIGIKDQKQSDGSSIVEIGTNETNSLSTLDRLNIASGYNYIVEVNTTSHIDNNATYGYTKEYMHSTIPYIWTPSEDRNVSGCNDIKDKNVTTTFIHGKIYENVSIPQVGEYLMSFRDIIWTSPDSNRSYMKHHYNDDDTIKEHFKDELDCAEDSTVVYEVDESGKNGCYFSSEHNNTELNTTYHDYNLTIHPYKFDVLGLNYSRGFDNSVVFNDDSFLYMVDISNNLDENLSFHINGKIKANAYVDTNLTNFVTECYAEDINLSLDMSDTKDDTTFNFQYRLKLIDKDGNITLDTNATNLDDNRFSITQDKFQKEMNGTIDTILNLNFQRTKDKAKNPVKHHYNSYNIDCSNSDDCKFIADINKNLTTKGKLTIDKPLKYYYGRTHTAKQTIINTDGEAYLYFEVYCSEIGCDKSLLPNGENSNVSDDARWFLNNLHKKVLGNEGRVKQKTQSKVTVNSQTGDDDNITISLTYDGTSGYPYKTTMDNNASNWLIYNKYNPDDTTNDFQVEFLTDNKGWAGEHRTDTTTNSKASSKTNKRLMSW